MPVDIFSRAPAIELYREYLFILVEFSQTWKGKALIDSKLDGYISYHLLENNSGDGETPAG